MNTRMTNTTPGEGTPPTSAPSHSHGGQGQNIASSGTQSFQDPNVINIAASSGTPESIGEALPGTIGTKNTRVNKGTLKGEAASSGTSGAASAAHHTATTQQDSSDYSESSDQSSPVSSQWLQSAAPIDMSTHRHERRTHRHEHFWLKNPLPPRPTKEGEKAS